MIEGDKAIKDIALLETANARITELEKALKNIMLHQRTVCPTGTKMSITYQIAAKAFHE